MEWKNQKENAYSNIFLSDCTFDEIYLNDNNIIIKFRKHGFIVKEDENSQYYHTKASEIIMKECDINNIMIQIIINKKRIGGKIIRIIQDIEICIFWENIAKKKWKYEIVEEYYSEMGGWFVGQIKSRKKSMWCYIQIQFKGMIYFWNEIDYDALVQ